MVMISKCVKSLKNWLVEGTGMLTKKGAQSAQFSDDLVQMSVVTAQMSLGV